MPRTKGSKNKPKTVTADFATQIAEKQSAKEALAAEIASITANIDTLKADLKVKKTALKKAEKELTTLESRSETQLVVPVSTAVPIIILYNIFLSFIVISTLNVEL